MNNNFKQSEGDVRLNNYHGIDSLSQARESDGEEHPAPGGGGDMTGLSGVEAPRLVIREYGGKVFKITSIRGKVWKLSQRVTIINLSRFTLH